MAWSGGTCIATTGAREASKPFQRARIVHDGSCPDEPSRTHDVPREAGRRARGCPWFSATERYDWGERRSASARGTGYNPLGGRMQRHELVAAAASFTNASVFEPSPLDTRRRLAATSRWSSSVVPGSGRAGAELGVRVERGTTPRGRCRARQASSPGGQRGGKGARDRRPRCLSSLCLAAGRVRTRSAALPYATFPRT